MTAVGIAVDSSRPSARPSQAEPKRPSEPWSAGQVSRVLGVSALGLIGVCVGWFGAGGTLSLSQELMWTVLAIAGVALAAVGQGMFVLDAFRVIKARRLAVMTDVAALVGRYEPADHTGPTEVADTDRVATPTMTHYHRPWCPLAHGKDDLHAAPAQAHLDAGRSACGVCDA